MSGPFIPSATLLAQDRFFIDISTLRIALAHDERTKHWIITPAELGVQRARKVQVTEFRPDDTRVYTDRVHKLLSYHYERLAIDLNLFVPVDHTLKLYRQVVSSDAPEWQIIHALWLPLDPLNQVMPSSSADANHLSRDVDGHDPRI